MTALPPEDCYIVERPAFVAPKPVSTHKPKRKKVRKPLFKKDVPVDWELECESALPPVSVVLPPEPEGEFTPVPPLSLIPPEPPASEPCDCFADTQPPRGFIVPGPTSGPFPSFSPTPVVVSAPIPAVPEPSAIALLLAGTTVVVSRLWSLRRKQQTK